MLRLPLLRGVHPRGPPGGARVLQPIRVLWHTQSSTHRRIERCHPFNPLCVCVFCVLFFSLFIARYSYCAVFGTDFASGGREALALFRRRGWGAAKDDLSLCSASLFYASLCVAVGVSLVAYFLASVFGARGMRGLLVAVTLVTGSAMCWCATSVLDAGALAVLVLLADDPEAIAAAHPAELAALLETWRNFYGEELDAAGYGKLES